MSQLQLQPGQQMLILETYLSQAVAGAWFELPYPPVATLLWCAAIDMGTASALNINLEGQISAVDPAMTPVVVSTVTNPKSGMTLPFAVVSPGAIPLVRANVTQFTLGTGTPRIRAWVRL